MEDFETPPDLISKADQAMASFKSLGEMYGAFYQALTANDVPANAATTIVVAYVCSHPTVMKKEQ